MSKDQQKRKGPSGMTVSRIVALTLAVLMVLGTISGVLIYILSTL